MKKKYIVSLLGCSLIFMSQMGFCDLKVTCPDYEQVIKDDPKLHTNYPVDGRIWHVYGDDLRFPRIWKRYTEWAAVHLGHGPGIDDHFFVCQTEKKSQTAPFLLYNIPNNYNCRVENMSLICKNR